MEKKLIKDWIDNVKTTVNMPGTSSCSMDLSIGLSHAFKKPDETKRPVLFVISCQNYYQFDGIQLNNEAYTAYPYEKEVLLSEGCKVYILKVEKKVRITNTHVSYSNYHGKLINIIHLFI